MTTGTVKWFNATKGYGFISPEEGGNDVFVHITALEKAGIAGLNDGQKVNYEIVTNRGKQAADNIELAD
ncbi:MAG: cold-shock protein [Robiginitomaculum sp.]|nr:cold-shock protein [Robiginitomaculum sp.]MBN4047830.1 cold-shock protein [Oceanicaulis sp. AH-315-P02]MCF6292394.1 cold-shock protein [Robiginitomaculum sp.]